MDRLMAKGRRSKIQGWRERLSRASDYVIPMWMIEYQGHSPLTECHVFKLRMPITDNWEPLVITNEYFESEIISMPVSEKLDYWIQMKNLLMHARDYAPMSGDLSPLTQEERSMFGVRIIKPNPCFPEKGYGFGLERFNSSLY
jgi:hypothetical protein